MGENDGADRRARAARERERREMEGVESLTGGADLSAGHGRAELGRLGRGEGGKERERAAQVGPNSAQSRGFLFFFF
jgi:hypothetical protein